MLSTGAGASNTTSSMSAPPTALSNERKPLDGEAISEEGSETNQSAFSVSKEEAEELNAKVKAIKTKGALSMWKNKALV